MRTCMSMHCGAHPAHTPPCHHPSLPPSLPQFELHDVLELQQAALAEGRPRQQQSPAIYCGGLCWWAVSAPPL